MDLSELNSKALMEWLLACGNAIDIADAYIESRDQMSAKLMVAKRMLEKRKEGGMTAAIAVIVTLLIGTPFMIFMFLFPNTLLFWIVRGVIAAGLVALAFPLIKALRKAFRPPEADRVAKLEQMIAKADHEWGEYRNFSQDKIASVRLLPRAYRYPDVIRQLIGYVEKGWADNWESLAVLYESRNFRQRDDEAPQTSEAFSKSFWWNQCWMEEEE